MPPQTPFDAILEQARDVFRDRLCAAVGAMLGHAEESFTALLDTTEDEELQRRFIDTRDLLADRRDELDRQFRTRVVAEFDKRARKARNVAHAIAAVSLGELELVAEDDLNETLKFNDMAARLARYCEEELAALNQRAGVLLGDAGLESDDNPFGPKTVCDAFKQAARSLDWAADARLVLLRLFDGSVLDAIRAGYKDVNGLLVENGILPKIRYGISKHDDKAAAPEAAAPPPAQDMFAMLSKMLGTSGGGAGMAGIGVGGVPQVQGAQLQGALTRLQVGDLSALGEAAAEIGPLLAEAGGLQNVLHRIKSTSIGASLGQVDAATLDIVARLFDELFDDGKIPIALKGLLGRLQLPFLKVAIADKELFTAPDHPARLFLDTLGQIGVRLPAEFDDGHPSFPRIRSAIQEIIDRYDDGIAIFDEVRAGLEVLLEEDDRRIAGEMDAIERQLRNAELLTVATGAAQQAIRERIAASPAVPKPVVDFIAQEWIKHLVIVHARDGEESAAWSGAVATLDQLLWSVAPKPTAEERHKLPAAIPALLRGLKAGVADAQIPGDTAAAFFIQLMQCHTEAMRPVIAPRPARKSARPVEAGAALGRETKAAPVEAPKPAPTAEDLLDFTQPVTVNNPFGEGEVQVSADDLDFTATTADEAPPTVALADSARTAPAPKAAGAQAPAARLPAAMVVGAWCEILETREGDVMRPARLYYESPKKTHYLFVDRAGNKVYECSRSMLSRRLKAGEIVMLDGEPDASLFDRIMQGLFGKLRAVPA